MPGDAGLIGPNAITQVAEALKQQLGSAETGRLFQRAGLEHFLLSLPEDMVEEAAVTALHRCLREALDDKTARSVARDAGVTTAHYLLKNRIPRAAQLVLRALPAFLASRALIAAIQRHAWTFSGSGQFTAEAGNPTTLAISNCPLCRGAVADAPVCDYYGACFEALFQTLVHSRASVTESDCQAMGAPACRFILRW